MTTKYEVKVLMSKEELVDEKLKKLQEEDWEIAGDILLKNKTGNCNDTYLFIPLKKVII